MARSEIAAQTALTPAAVSRIVGELIAVGLVTEGAEHASDGRPGRRFVDVKVAPAGGYVVGLSFEAYKQKIALADLEGRILVGRTIPVEAPEQLADCFNAAASEIDAIVRSSGIPRDRILGAGVVVVGGVDPETGIVSRSPSFGWRETKVQELLEARTNIPVHVDNVVNAIALLEVEAGSCRGAKDVIVVRAALAVNASIISGGKLLRGRFGHVGRIGHGHVGGVDRICLCGRKGCLDTVASGWGILTTLGEVSPDETWPANFAEHAKRLESVLERANAGDNAVKEALFAAGERLGLYLCGLGATLNPEHIVLTGSVGAQPDYIRGVKSSIAARYYSPPDHGVNVVACNVATEAAAVRLALSEFLLSPRLDITRLRTSIKYRPLVRAIIRTAGHDGKCVARGAGRGPMKPGLPFPFTGVDGHVDISTPEGHMQTFAAFPSDRGCWPAIVMFMDAVGLRDELRNMARFIAAQGYACLVPNLYYRDGGPSFDPEKPQRQREQFMPLADRLTHDAIVSDTAAVVQWAAGDARIDNGPKGCIGFCMGGRFAVWAAEEFPEHFRATVSMFGPRMVTDSPVSPHRHVARLSGESFFAFGEEDPYVPASDVEALRSALTAANCKFRMETYPSANHAFIFPLRWCYLAQASEKAWAGALAVFAGQLRRGDQKAGTAQPFLPSP